MPSYVSFVKSALDNQKDLKRSESSTDLHAKTLKALLWIMIVVTVLLVIRGSLMSDHTIMQGF